MYPPHKRLYETFFLLRAVNHFTQKAPSQIFHRVLNMTQICPQLPTLIFSVILYLQSWRKTQVKSQSNNNNNNNNNNDNNNNNNN